MGGRLVSSLVITQPGGHQVSTEEIFALIDQLTGVRGALEETVAGLTSVRGSYRPEGYQSAIGQASVLADDARWLVAAMVAYTEQVARQETWRVAWWESTRDHAWWGLATLMTGGQAPSGRREESRVDDVARAILASGGDHRPHVRVWETSREYGTTVSQGVAERVARIPAGSNPVRIERYETPGGQWHTEVFVSGTRQWGLDSTGDPFDMRSNLALVAGVPAAATLATERAMRNAGVRRGDSVVFVGHSQGGAVAATLAESGRYRTRGLITVGAPVGSIPVTGDYPALRIEHRDDVVVELGGAPVAGRQIVVETDSGALPGDVRGAHSRHGYFDTAARVDQSPVSALSRWGEALPSGIRGRSVLFDASAGARPGA